MSLISYLESDVYLFSFSRWRLVLDKAKAAFDEGDFCHNRPRLSQGFMQAVPEETSTSVIVLVLMGVAGSGKTTVGLRLAREIGFAFVDADQFHSFENKAKMAAGHPLDDDDREPWLKSMRTAIDLWLRTDCKTVLACSALKHHYRALLAIDERVQFAYLKADPTVLSQRLKQRPPHFMKGNMLQSQFQALEEPTDSEAITINADEPVEVVIQQIRSSMSL